MFPLLEVVQAFHSLLLPTVIVFRQSPVLTHETISHQNMYCKNLSRNTRQLPNTSPQCRGNKTTYCVLCISAGDYIVRKKHFNIVKESAFQYSPLIKQPIATNLIRSKSQQADWLARTS